MRPRDFVVSQEAQGGSTPLLPDDGGPLGEDVCAEPLTAIGLTWLERGTAYRRRRRRVVIQYVVVFVFIGAMAGLFDAAIVVGGGPVAVRVAAAIGYLLLAVPAYLFARRKIRRYGFEWRTERRGPLVGSGIFVIVMAPVAVGLVVACLQAVLEPWFPGEQAARQQVLQRRSAQHPVLH